MMNLSERTGMAAFMFITRDHALDTQPTGYMNTDGVLRFFVEILGMSAPEISRKFESWNSSLVNSECHK